MFGLPPIYFRVMAERDKAARDESIRITAIEVANGDVEKAAEIEAYIRNGLVREMEP